MERLTWREYVIFTQEILESESPAAPYDNPDYFQYTKLNATRMKRWIKTNPIFLSRVS